MSKLVYAVCDTAFVNDKMTLLLEREGYHVQSFESGHQLYQAFLHKPCDLAVIDIELPGSDGFMVCAKLKQMSYTPVIAIIGQDSEDNYVFGISLGIDVCLVKPLSMAKLLVHMRALLIKAELQRVTSIGLPHVPHLSKRVEPARPAPETAKQHYADITICPNRLAAFCGSQALKLTNTEYRMLLFLIRNQHSAISRTLLQQNLWGEKTIGVRAIDDVVKRLRRKLQVVGSAAAIETVWGYGFRLTKAVGGLAGRAI